MAVFRARSSWRQAQTLISRLWWRAWVYRVAPEACSILAQSPRDFKGSGDIVYNDITKNPEYSVTNKGIKFFNWYVDREGSNHAGGFTLDPLLSCRRRGCTGSLYITLRRLKDDTWYRCKSESFPSHGSFWTRSNQVGVCSRQRHFYVTAWTHTESGGLR